MMHFRNKTQFAGHGNAQQQCLSSLLLLSSLLFPVLATVPFRGATHRSVGALEIPELQCLCDHIATTSRDRCSILVGNAMAISGR